MNPKHTRVSMRSLRGAVAFAIVSLAGIGISEWALADSLPGPNEPPGCPTPPREGAPGSIDGPSGPVFPPPPGVIDDSEAFGPWGRGGGLGCGADGDDPTDFPDPDDTDPDAPGEGCGFPPNESPGPGGIHAPGGGMHGGQAISRANLSNGASYASLGNSDSTTVFPITWTGSVAESPVDFRLPSKGVSWSHARFYNQYVDSDGSGVDSDVETPQGFNWSYSYWWHLAQGSGSAIEYWHDLRRQYSYNFASISDGTFVSETNKLIRSRLVHNHPDDPSHTYRLQKPNGIIWLFYDFDSSLDVDIRGKFWKAIGKYPGASGEPNELVVNYDDAGQITYITDSSGHYIRYSWVASGNLQGMLGEIKIWQDSTTNDDNKLIAKLTFTYKDGDTSSHAECGTLKDLILVEVSVRDSNDTTALGITRKTHYRYWKNGYSDNSGNGRAHQLRYICRGRETRRCGAASINVLTVSNAILKPTSGTTYVSSAFTYYDSGDELGRVHTEEVLNNVACCGSGGGLKGTYTYTYTKRSGAISTRNEWALQTKEVRPDGSTRWVETNKFGQIYVASSYQDVDGNDGDETALNQVYHYLYDDTSGRIARIYTPSSITVYTASGQTLSLGTGGIVYAFEYETSSGFYRHALTKRFTAGFSSDPEDGQMIVYKTYIDPSTWSYRHTPYVDEVYIYPEATGDKDDSSRIKVRDYDYVMRLSQNRDTC